MWSGQEWWPLLCWVKWTAARREAVSFYQKQRYWQLSTATATATTIAAPLRTILYPPTTIPHRIVTSIIHKSSIMFILLGVIFHCKTICVSCWFIIFCRNCEQKLNRFHTTVSVDHCKNECTVWGDLEVIFSRTD